MLSKLNHFNLKISLEMGWLRISSDSFLDQLRFPAVDQNGTIGESVLMMNATDLAALPP